MERIEEKLRGLVYVEVTGAEPEALLNACAAEELPLLRPQSEDAFTLRFGVFEDDLKRLQAIAGRCGCDCRVLERRGGSRTRSLLRRRLPLLLTMTALLCLLLLSSLFVWEIRLVGAENISRGELLRALEDCGLSPGIFWPRLDAEALRDRMLLREGRLAWLTVNIRGSVAEVLLLRREEKPPTASDAGAADLAASHAGIVRQLSVLDGQALVQPGMAVTAGETLVSGRVESLTAAPRLLRARGEVWADTWYTLTAVCPAGTGKESRDTGRRNRLALRIGTRRIIFYQNSGKAIDGCDKIVHEYNLGIEGLFRLPVSLIREELRPFSPAGEHAVGTEEMAQRLLAELAGQIDGEIVSYEVSTGESEGLTVVTLRAQCRENIAQTVDIIP